MKGTTPPKTDAVRRVTAATLLGAAIALCAPVASASAGAAASGVENGDGPLGPKIEWLSLRGGIGLYGVSVTATAFTLRAEHFYWEIARAAFSCLFAGLRREVGTAIGIKQPLARGRRPTVRELRYGLGVMFGEAYSLLGFGSQVSSDDPGYWFEGLIAVPEVAYYRYFFPHLAFVAGIDLHIPAVEIDDILKTSDEYPFPDVDLFLGFAI
jgi:hypothetical protein